MNAANAVFEPETQFDQPAQDAGYQSWGRFPRVAHRRIHKIFRRDQLPELLQNAEPGSLLTYGMGRSYGDSCLNENRDLLDCRQLNRILEFDSDNGWIRVEAGATLGDLLKIIVPQGWFLPVTPGTKFVTVGGAIANDVHGKNHHRAGTFGSHVDQMMLYRSNGSFTCSLSSEADLFRATVGGLGLTGVIGWADIHLKRIAGNAIEVETIAFEGLDEFIALAAESDQSFEYTVAWVDCLSGSHTRGIFFRGNHVDRSLSHKHRAFKIPFVFPEFVLNRTTISLFNAAYYRLSGRKAGNALVPYDQFFYPLDSLLNWNLLYGERGLVQYQCVIPSENVDVLKDVLETVSKSGEGSFLSVLKVFGKIKSPGLLSFPRPGATLTLDLPMRGSRTLKLLDVLDQLVQGAGGALYSAKDARMSAQTFAMGFPRISEFVRFIDPTFSSSFWRRVSSPRSLGRRR